MGHDHPETTKFCDTEKNIACVLRPVSLRCVWWIGCIPRATSVANGLWCRMWDHEFMNRPPGPDLDLSESKVWRSNLHPNPAVWSLLWHGARLCDVSTRQLQHRFCRGSKSYHWQVVPSAEHGSSCGYWHPEVRPRSEAADTFWAPVAWCTWMHQV